MSNQQQLRYRKPSCLGSYVHKQTVKRFLFNQLTPSALFGREVHSLLNTTQILLFWTFLSALQRGSHLGNNIGSEASRLQIQKRGAVTWVAEGSSARSAATSASGGKKPLQLWVWVRVVHSSCRQVLPLKTLSGAPGFHKLQLKPFYQLGFFTAVLEGSLTTEVGITWKHLRSQGRAHHFSGLGMMHQELINLLRKCLLASEKKSGCNPLRHLAYFSQATVWLCTAGSLWRHGILPWKLLCFTVP